VIEERQETFLMKERPASSSRTSISMMIDEMAITRRGIPFGRQYRQAAKRAAADIEKHSTAAEYSQPGRLRRELLMDYLARKNFKISDRLFVLVRAPNL
jgi:hypothetical protein